MAFGQRTDFARPSTFSAGVSAAGTLVRFGFYAAGLGFFLVVGLGLHYLWGNRVVRVDAKPAFRINDSSLASLPTTTRVISGGNLGRIEVINYGSIHNRESDLAVAMVTPDRTSAIDPQIAVSLRHANIMQNAQVLMTSNYYDLNTRFGEIRAVEMRVDSDGRWKQCLAYRSRFNDESAYLLGWSCDGSGAKPSADHLACVLDKLTLERPLASAEADAFLRAKALRPASCSARAVTQTSDTGSRRISPPSRWSRPSANTSYSRYY